MHDSINQDLSRFIGPGSIEFFEIAQLNNSFLSEPVASWELSLHYHETKKKQYWIWQLQMTQQNEELSSVQTS